MDDKITGIMIIAAFLFIVVVNTTLLLFYWDKFKEILKELLGINKKTK